MDNKLKYYKHPTYNGYGISVNKSKESNVIDLETKQKINSYHRCSDNYVRIFNTYLHKFVIECKLRRLVCKPETIDHIDGNPRNNNLSNLKLYSNHSKHLKKKKCFKRNYNCYIYDSKGNFLSEEFALSQICEKYKLSGPQVALMIDEKIYGYLINDDNIMIKIKAINNG